MLEIPARKPGTMNGWENAGFVTASGPCLLPAAHR